MSLFLRFAFFRRSGPTAARFSFWFPFQETLTICSTIGRNTSSPVLRPFVIAATLANDRLMRTFSSLLSVSALCLLSCSPASTAPLPHDLANTGTSAAEALCAALGKGINFGNMLESPHEGEWGLRLEESYFKTVSQAGFDTVRLPINWAAHTSATPPYPIDPVFLKRIDLAINQALAQKLKLIINVHHFDELTDQPAAQEARFLAIWAQLATHYQSLPPDLYFELLNEPRDPMTAEQWNDLIAKTVPLIRKTNPQRGLIVGPVQWNNIERLKDLRLPSDDRLIATVHYYEPFHFTHQGAEWAEGSQQWLGLKWGSEADQAKVKADFATAADWSRRSKRPVFLGEFGAFEQGDVESRARWIAFVRQQAEQHQMPWAYWEFGAGFGVYDLSRQAWRRPLSEALLGTPR